jgi:hypothetical protein
MTRLVIKKSAIRQFIGPLSLYVMGSLAAVAVFRLGDWWMLLLFLIGAIVVYLTWRRMPWPDPWSRYLSFASVLLLMCLLDRAFYITDYFVNGTQFAAWPFLVQSPRVAVFKGEFIAIVGTLLTVSAWRLCGGMRFSPATVMEQPKQTARIVVVIYLASLMGMLLAARVPLATQLLGQLLPTLLGMGLVTTFLLPMVRFRGNWSRLLAVMVLSLPFAILAVGTGMKENFILALIPSGVMAWRCFSHPLLRSAMVVAGLAALALITSYVSFYRQEVWWPESHGMPASQTVPQDFLRKIDTVGLPKTMGDGLADFIERSDGSYRHGWAVSIADEQKFHPELVFEPLTYIFVPRMFWPGKPRNVQGVEYTSLITGEQISLGGSSTAAGFYPALYLGYGWPAFLAGSLLAGALLAAMTHLAQRFGGRLTAGLYIFSMLPFMLRMNSNWPVEVLSKPVISLVYVSAIVLFARATARVVLKTRRVPASSP